MSQELLMAASALMGLLVIAGATLKGWQDWLALKSREIEVGRRLRSRAVRGRFPARAT